MVSLIPFQCHCHSSCLCSLAVKSKFHRHRIEAKANRMSHIFATCFFQKPATPKQVNLKRRVLNVHYLSRHVTPKSSCIRVAQSLYFVNGPRKRSYTCIHRLYTCSYTGLFVINMIRNRLVT